MTSSIRRSGSACCIPSFYMAFLRGHVHQDQRHRSSTVAFGAALVGLAATRAAEPRRLHTEVSRTDGFRSNPFV
ncbi:hypothetical protein A8926_6669 [Saccharopolyspora spinosa]|uniref:Uncharacterized protein n=1 Tax=Saccharopolyspora spinosa TaxID=60894 RepID=A0A2N3Y6N5_SACSN|nr:hypothetical protein A8926_6669 [Saccharopolyspora spinosa]